mmetsp:Transcript_83/g.157  ORF Transcript_83/g.157 Transcript_83/m.157 type:complete len:381 (-) Transcript_83:209-1351(-)
MGGGISVGVGGLNPSLAEFRHEFNTLCLKNAEIKSLYDVYLKMDNSQNNAVDIEAIFLFLDISNEFLRKVFIYTLQMKLKQYDTTAVNTEHGENSCREVTSLDSCAISFDVFVYAIWSFCSLQPSFFELLVFDVYLGEPDQEYLSNLELQEMLADIYGPGGGESFHARRAISILQDNDCIDDYYDIDDFYDFTYQNSVVQFALFILQSKIHAAICGFAFWEKIGDLRYRKFYSYSSIAEILHWGEFADDSNSTTSAAPRKFSSSAIITSQRLVQDVFRPGKTPGLEEDSNSGAQQEQGSPTSPQQHRTFVLPMTGFNAAFAAHSQLQERRNSKSKLVQGTAVDNSRRRSFDVTIIIKESSFSSYRREPSVTDHRRHSVVV